MPANSTLRVRPSLISLQQEYDLGNKKPLEDLMLAWKGIKELPPEDPLSFFALAGHHGAPLQYRAAVDELEPADSYPYWGGYCNHGNVLFPTWHRMYVLKVEQALQSIVPGVMLPYWDESDDYALKNGIPAALTREKFELDGASIDNPLRSFVLPVALSDGLSGDAHAYEKPIGYETVRYPMSGLVGTPEARTATLAHNAQYPNFRDNVGMLNENLRAWMRGGRPTVANPNPTNTGVYAKMLDCLSAPNFTVFSNTTSAAQWNLINPGKVTSLESPHNSIHLAVGGFDFPDSQVGQLAGANGDMGENNTAGMDPIFFFHHCNIDRLFWLWQKRHGMTDKLEIIKGFAGTAASDSQGPTPGMNPTGLLDMDSPLTPFKKIDGAAYTSRDCINIETQFGLTYAPGSLDPDLAGPHHGDLETPRHAKKLHVSGINRSAIQGSFILTAYALTAGQDGTTVRHELGHSAKLSRYNVAKCANCLTHLDVMTHFALHDFTDEQLDQAEFHVELHSRTGVVELTPGSNLQRYATFAAIKPGKPTEIRIVD